jgi:hypothetical protein
VLGFICRRAVYSLTEMLSARDLHRYCLRGSHGVRFGDGCPRAVILSSRIEYNWRWLLTTIEAYAKRAGLDTGSMAMGLVWMNAPHSGFVCSRRRRPLASIFALSQLSPRVLPRCRFA